MPKRISLNPKQEWCSNSRRWILWMSMNSSIPKTCPYNIANSGCAGPGCGYYEMKEASAGFKRKHQMHQDLFGDDE